MRVLSPRPQTQWITGNLAEEISTKTKQAFFVAALPNSLENWKNFFSVPYKLADGRRRGREGEMEEGKTHLFLFRQETGAGKRFLCQYADQRKGGAQGKQVHKKEVAYAECQFCNRALLY